jgi:hypothetical protein
MREDDAGGTAQARSSPSAGFRQSTWWSSRAPASSGRPSPPRRRGEGRRRAGGGARRIRHARDARPRRSRRGARRPERASLREDWPLPAVRCREKPGGREAPEEGQAPRRGRTRIFMGESISHGCPGRKPEVDAIGDRGRCVGRGAGATGVRPSVAGRVSRHAVGRKSRVACRKSRVAGRGMPRRGARRSFRARMFFFFAPARVPGIMPV